MRLYLSLEVFKKDFVADFKFFNQSLEEEQITGVEEEDQPSGDVFTNMEHAHSYTMEPEMHAGHRPDYWGVEEDRARRSRATPVRRQPMGFTRRAS